MSVAATDQPAAARAGCGRRAWWRRWRCSWSRRDLLLRHRRLLPWCARPTTARAWSGARRCSAPSRTSATPAPTSPRSMPRHIKGMERTAGLKDLRFETEPVAGDREIQSVLDGQGRIIGWFSWEPDRSMSNALGQLRPLLALTGVFLIGFAGIALWQVRRARARPRRQRAARLEARPRGHAHRPAQPPQDDRADRRRAGRAARRARW